MNVIAIVIRTDNRAPRVHAYVAYLHDAIHHTPTRAGVPHMVSGRSVTRGMRPSDGDENCLRVM
jgi:hypothetical protein|eukprot:COSAG02_NODE_70_length_42239_cov_15.323090_5_plen_64_part_00